MGSLSAAVVMVTLAVMARVLALVGNAVTTMAVELCAYCAESCYANAFVVSICDIGSVPLAAPVRAALKLGLASMSVSRSRLQVI